MHTAIADWSVDEIAECLKLKRSTKQALRQLATRGNIATVWGLLTPRQQCEINNAADLAVASIERQAA